MNFIKQILSRSNGGADSSSPINALLKVFSAKYRLATLGCSFMIFVAMCLFIVLISSVKFNAFEGYYGIGGASGEKYGEKQTEDWAEYNKLEGEEEAFYSKISDLVEKYKNKGKEVDEPLILATLFFDESVNVDENFECHTDKKDTENEETEDDEEDEDSTTNCESPYGDKTSEELYKDAEKLMKKTAGKSEDETRDVIEDYIKERVGDDLDDDSVDKIVDDIYDAKDAYVELTFATDEDSCTVSGSDFEELDDEEFFAASREDRISMLATVAQAAYSETGILPSVTLSQAITESGIGESAMAKDAKNLFGMRTASVTNEYWDGDVYQTAGNGDFKKYSSVSNAVFDYARNLTTEIYGNTSELTDPKEQIQSIADHGYCPGCDGYVDNQYSFIEQYDLTQYDGASNTCTANGSIDGDPDFTNVKAWRHPEEGGMNPFQYGQCTWFAWGRFYEVYGYDPGFRGNGSTNAQELCDAHPDDFYMSTTEVKPGAIFSVNNSQYGHVGFVAAVNGDMLTIQDGNYNHMTDPWEVAITDWKTIDWSIKGLNDNYGGGISFCNPKNPPTSITSEGGGTLGKSKITSKINSISAPSYDELRKMAKDKYHMDEQAFQVALGWTVGDTYQGQDDYISYLSACCPINTFKKVGSASFINQYTSWGSYYTFSQYQYRAKNAGTYARKVFYLAMTNLDTRPTQVNGVTIENGYATTLSEKTAIYCKQITWSHTLANGTNKGKVCAWK